MVNIQIYSETPIEETRGCISFICGYNVPLNNVSRFPANENWANFVLSPSGESLESIGCKNYRAQSFLSIYVYDSQKTEHSRLGHDLKLKLKRLIEQLEKPIILDSGRRWNIPVSLSDL